MLRFSKNFKKYLYTGIFIYRFLTVGVQGRSRTCTCRTNRFYHVLDVVLYPGIALLGCTDSNAINYNPNATIDDSSCVYPAGCTNPLAYNYNPSAYTSIAFGGIPSNSVGTGSYYSGNRHLIFDAYVESNIVSALVYAQNSNTITFLK